MNIFRLHFGEKMKKILLSFLRSMKNITRYGQKNKQEWIKDNAKY